MRSPPPGSPFPGFGTQVCSLGAVVETVGGVAGFASKGEEVELVAEGELAVGADECGVAGFDVGHGGVAVLFVSR